MQVLPCLKGSADPEGREVWGELDSLSPSGGPGELRLPRESNFLIWLDYPCLGFLLHKAKASR